MFARVSTYQGGTEQLLVGFRRTTEPLAQLEGSSAPTSSRLLGRSCGYGHAVGMDPSLVDRSDRL